MEFNSAMKFNSGGMEFHSSMEFNSAMEFNSGGMEFHSVTLWSSTVVPYGVHQWYGVQQCYHMELNSCTVWSSTVVWSSTWYGVQQ